VSVVVTDVVDEDATSRRRRRQRWRMERSARYGSLVIATESKERRSARRHGRRSHRHQHHLFEV